MSDKKKQQQSFDELQEWLDNKVQTQESPNSLKVLRQADRYSFPYESQSAGQLGSRREESIILQTGQLHYTEELVTLSGHQPLKFRLHYVSHSKTNSQLGAYWRHHYDSRFEESIENNERIYRLILPTGEQYVFPYDRENNKLIDQGQLGVSVNWIRDDDKTSRNTYFELRYFNGDIHRYRNERLVQQQDLHGNTLDFNYDDQERLSQVINSSGSQLNLNYNDNNQIDSVTDHGERRWQFTYSGEHRLSQIILPSQGKRHYSYIERDGENLLEYISNSLGQPLLEIKYYNSGRVAALRKNGLGKGEIYEYGDAQNLVIKRNGQGEETHYHLDKRGLIDSIFYPNGINHYQRWDEDQKTLTTSNDSGVIRTKKYDERSRLIENHDREVEERTRFYAYQGNNPLPSKIKTPTGTVKNRYDDRYRLVSYTDEKGRTERYEYDDKNNITHIVDHQGDNREIAYNSHDKAISEIDSQGNTTCFEYDELQRTIQISDAQGSDIHFAYTALNQITQVGSKASKYHFLYDTEGQQTGTCDAAGNASQFKYNNNRQFTQEIKDTGDSRSFHYDKEGRLSLVEREDGSHVNMEYKQHKDGLRCKETIGDMVTEYHFDNQKQLVYAKNADAELYFDYNSKGQVETESQNGVAVETAYVGKHCVSVSYLEEEIVYQRDKHGIAENIILNGAADMIRLAHNSSDQLTERHYPNQQIEQFLFEEKELSKIKTADKIIYYKHDSVGRIIQKDDVAYCYDDEGRLVKSGVTEYGYDIAGNITSQSICIEKGSEIAYQYDPKNNQLLENNSHTFSYDKRGNLVKKTHKLTQATLYYHYNAKNQLTSLTGQDFNSKTHKAEHQSLEFSYDPLGRRVTKKTPEATYEYLYNGFNIIAITITQGGDSHVVKITHDDEIDTPLSISSKNGTFYYHRDHQGSIIALTDSNGNTVENLVYDNYGNIIEHDKTVETYNPYGYTGREIDTKDLYYYRARYYSPSLKRFLSKDPIETLSGDFNLYTYVNGDPVNYVDPYGYQAKQACLSKKDWDELKKAAKPLANKLGGALAKRLGVFLASLAGGPIGGAIGGAVSLGMAVFDVIDAWGEIKGFYNAVSSVDVQGEINWKQAIMDLADGKDPFPVCESENVKTRSGPQHNTSKGNANNKKEDCKTCKKAGDKPVIFTGAKILGDEQELDFSINAPMPLVWQRNYASDNPRVGLLGQGWTLLSDSHLQIKHDKIIFAEPNGRGLEFEPQEVGESENWVVEQLTLSRPEKEKYTLETGSGTTLTFTPSEIAGKYLLRRIEDSNGNGLRYIYNYFNQKGQEDRLNHVLTDDKRIFRFGYLDSKKYERLASISELIWGDSQDREKDQPQYSTLVSYSYNDEGDLIEVSNHVGRITRQFEYKNHIMVAHKVPNGVESFYKYNEYSPKGKVLHNHVNTGESWTFDYHKQKTIVTDHSGRKTTYQFDKDDYLTGKIDALGQQLTKELDKDGLPEKIINEAGQETSYHYDSRGNATLIKSADGTSIQVSYHDDFNLPVEISDDLGNTSTFEYDGRSNLIKETAADGAVTSYEHDKCGRPIIITDAKGGKNHLKYDVTGNLIERTDCSGNSTWYRYDRHSNLSAITDTLKQTTNYYYDEEHRLVSITYPDKSTEQFTYNSHGQLIAYTDPNGNNTTYQLDIEGRPTKRTNALGGELEYQYDSHGRLIRLINENKAKYKFAYDPLDRLIHEQGIDGLITGYSYDPVGNVIQKLEDETGKAQRKTRFIRDKGGRLLEKYIAKGEMHSRTRYQYDEIGQLTQARNEHSRVDLAYDSLGRLSEEITTTKVGEHKLMHQYDALGNRIKTALPDGRQLNWLYYGSGHLHQINLDGEVISDFERDQLHREITRTQGKLKSQTHYDPLGRILQQQVQRRQQIHQHDKDSQPPSLNGQGQYNINNQLDYPVQLQRNYTYDKAGELTQINDSKNGITRYQYDKLGRITQTQQPDLAETFAFDPAHNLIPADKEQPATQGYIKDNRLRVYQDKRYDYDTFGNLVSKKIGKHTEMQFSYDAEHQMQQVVITKNNTTQTYQYRYDPFGRRISKTDTFNATYFIWDGNRLLSELRGKQSTTYVYEQDGFVPIAQLDQDSQINHYHTDHLGTPRELSNNQGNIIWEATYQTWGNTLKVSYQPVEQQTALQPELQPLRFQGQYYDAETGLHYNRFRYYDPDVGRFVSHDPIGLLGGSNLYRYSPNPNKWIDPLGLCSIASKKPPIIIGENMKRLKEYAKLVGGQTYRPWKVGEPGRDWTDEEKAVMMKRNRRWIRDKMREGRCIIDVGPDHDRRNNPERGSSDFYEMERRETRGYKYYKKAFMRDGNSGGVPNVDF